MSMESYISKSWFMLWFMSQSAQKLSPLLVYCITSYKARFMYEFQLRVHIINPILPRLLWGFLDTSLRKCPNLSHFIFWS